MSEDDKSLMVVKPQGQVSEIKKDLASIQKLLKDAMTIDVDYGIIPGTQSKTLFDPGAEKLAKFFQLIPDYESTKEVEDFDKGFFYYRYKCKLTHFNTGKFAGASERSCNSFEKKFLSKTVAETWASDEDKAQTISKKKNDKGYVMLVVKKSNIELIEGINSYQARAQKRAFVEAVRTATMASSIFGSDGADVEEAPNKPVTKEQDPERIKVMGHLFGVASDRGYNPESVKQFCYKRFNVESMDNVSNKQMSDLSEYLVTNFEVVPKGEKPKQFGKATTSPEPQEETKVVEEKKDPLVSPSSEVEEGEIVETASEEMPWEKEEREKEEAEEKGIKTAPVEKTCYQCHKPIAEGYYCNTECQDAYWSKSGTSTQKQRFEDFLKKNKK